MFKRTVAQGHRNNRRSLAFLGLVCVACGGSNSASSQKTSSSGGNPATTAVSSSGGQGLLGGSGGTTSAMSNEAGGTRIAVSNTLGGSAAGSGGVTQSSAGGAPAGTTLAPSTGGRASTTAVTGGTLSANTGGKATTGGTVPANTGGTATTGGTLSANTGGKASTSGGATSSSASASGGATSAGSPSSGCGSTQTPASGRFSIDVSGTPREYIITLPDGYDPRRPYRLIFAFHGRQYDAESVASGGPPGSGPYYGIASQANGSAIFVAPQALDTSWTNQSGRDLAFVSAMVNRFETQLCIDQTRIFATGFSMGAILTIAIGCNNADVFRAIAPMSGMVQGTCPASHPIAYWGSHGTNDPTIPIANGQAARDVFTKLDGCTSQVPGSPDGCVNYQCDPQYPVTFCTFDGVHEPPPFAGTAIWAFLSQF